MGEQFDVIIVGAGYVGACTAYHLSKAGVKAALFDLGPFAAAASRANFGNIQIQDMELKKSVTMIQMATKKFETLEEELDWNVGLRRIGGLIPIENEKQWRLMEERQRIARAAGFPSELVPVERLKEIEPFLNASLFIGGLYNPNEGQVDPFQFIWAHLTRARQRGLKEFYGAEVTGFKLRSGRVEGIQTTKGDFYAGTVVLCTGARTRLLGRTLGRDWDVNYILGQAMVTEPVRQVMAGHIASASFFEQSSEGGEKGRVGAVLAMSQSIHGHVLLGEGEYSADHFRRDVPAESMLKIGKMVARYYPALRKLKVLRGWSAPVAGTNDGCPMLGPVPGLDGLILATAFRSTVIISPLTGETIKQLVTRGNCDLDISSFLPERNNSYAF